MKKKFSFIISLVIIACGAYAQVDSLVVNYYENYPCAYKEGGKPKGLEIDIIEEYVSWLKSKKNISVNVNYRAYSEFGAFYSSVKDGNASVVGLGTVTDNADREKEVVFSAPYLKNVAVLVTDGSVPTVRTKNIPEVQKYLGGRKALVVSKSNHLKILKKVYDQNNLSDVEVKIAFTEKESNVLDSIAANKKVFGYVDIIAYWSYLKKNPTKFLKIQKIFNDPNEYLGFIMPKNNLHSQYLNEFFEGGFGFTSTKLYHQILEKYLGYEILESVEIK